MRLSNRGRGGFASALSIIIEAIIQNDGDRIDRGMKNTAMKKTLGLGLILLVMMLLFSGALAQSGFSLPEDAETIQASAFENVPLEDSDVVLPETLKRIESRAFAGTGITGIYIPSSVQYIAPDAFDISGEFHPVVRHGSFAEDWCEENHITAYVIYKPGVVKHSQAEIRSFVSSHPVDLKVYPEYRVQPTGGSFDGDVYSYGLLTEDSLNNAIAMVNQIRFIAGLNADIVNCPEQEERLAAAAMVNRLNGYLSHYPERPEVLADSRYDELYKQACAGAGSSNLHSGYPNLPWTVLSYMDDSDYSNIDRVGHRRWILNPEMGRTTFGYYQSCSGMYAFDSTGTGEQTMVVWPAQQTPLDYYGGDYCAWSASFGYYLDEEYITVKVVQRGTDEEWHFSAQSADGYFNVENSWYGQPGCVIFRPAGLSLEAGDSYRVTITDEENYIILEYDVVFFDL